MPCTNDGMAEYIARQEAEKEKRESMDALLCSACRSLELAGFDFDTNPMLSRWWDKHKKEDARREAKEAKEAREVETCRELNKKPFGKLTDADKQLLRKHGYL